MQNSIQKEKKPPVIKTIALIAAGLTVPTEVTENVTVLAITEHGCVGESELGVSVVVPECTSQVGEVVSATFFVPAMEKNGYYDRIESKLAMVEP
jgi:hypothetical protein